MKPVRRLLCASFALVVLQSVGAFAEGGVKRVMIFSSFGQYVAPFGQMTSIFRSSLAQELGLPIEFIDISINSMLRPMDSHQEKHFLDYLESSLADRPVDLIVSVGAPAAIFALTHRQQLFPDTPVLLTAADPRVLPPESSWTNTTLISHHVSERGMMEDILQLQPDTTNIMVVLGSSPLEKFWAKELRRAFNPFTNRVGLTWLDDLSLQQVMERCADAPPRTFILYGLFLVDAAGIPFEDSVPLRKLHDVARAPIYGYFEGELGLGIVGGRLYPSSEVGEQCTRAAIRILHGEHPEHMPPLLIPASVHKYDWRELRRWNLKTDGLPDGSVMLFRQPSYWELYWERTLFVGILLIVQSCLIVGILRSRTRLRRTEAAARELSQQLIAAHEKERARLARELHDDITQRLAGLSIDAGRAEIEAVDRSGRETLRSIREGLVRLSEDIHALSYRLHPSVLDDLGLADALKSECDHLLYDGDQEVTLNVGDLPKHVPKDAALCIFRVTQEALRNALHHANARHITVAVRVLENGLQASVTDDGSGFDPSARRAQKSLGLASMRERVHLLGGELEIDSEPGHGTTIVAWVPLSRE